jgi:anti-sigma factor RsiW
MITDEDREDLTAYLDGEADPKTRARIESRLNSDPALRAEADALKKAWEMLDHLSRTEPSPTFTSQTLDRLSAIRPTIATTMVLPVSTRRMPWSLLLTAVAAMVIGWGATNAWIKSKSEKPLDLDDPVLVKELRLVENLPLYLAVENMEYLQALDQSERFGPD